MFSGYKSDKNYYRYRLEHDLMPVFFFDQVRPFVQVLLDQRGELLVELFESLGTPCPYAMSDFSINPVIVAGPREEALPDFSIIHIDMPAPKEPLLCKRIFICHDVFFGTPAYFTLEKNETGVFFLCEWTSSREHLNHGVCAMDEKAAFSKVMEIYSERIWPTDNHTAVS